MTNVKWFIDRIRKMPPAEYAYRLNQIRKKRIDKSTSSRARENVAPPGDRRINVAKTNVSGIERCFPGIRAQAVEEGEKILKHRFRIFGIDADFGDPINWHLDPKTGRSWPMDFWGDIDYREGAAVGGIKFAWELNRFNHFPRLALAYALTGDDRFKAEIFQELESWLKANPYPKGIHWIMGIESAIRITNLVYSLRCLGAENLTGPQRDLLHRFVAGHARHLERYPSKYSSAGNHAVAEALGLYLAGSSFPGFPESRRWRESGRAVFIRQIERQIYPDGGSFEHSLSYLQFVLDQIIVFVLSNREEKAAVPAIVEKRLRSSLDLLASLVDRRGHLPAIGDGDDGFLLKLWFGAHNNALSLLNTGAVLFENENWIAEGAEFDPKTALLLGDGAKAVWEKLKTGRRAARLSPRYFSDSGIAVLRSERPKDILFVGNSGALGAPPLGAHGHADALSFWLSVDGRQVFIDPGTYLFHGAKPWRDYFRSTSAHNTIRLDDRDQAEIISDFMYHKFYGILDPRFAVTGKTISWSAAHDGYRRLRDPAIHRREVSFDRSAGRIEIRDDLFCRSVHAAESRFHFHPDCSVKKEDGIYRISSDFVILDFRVDPRWDRQELVRGRLEPPAGWYSPAFNVLQECWTLVLNARIEGPTVFEHAIEIVGEVRSEEINS